MNVVFINPFISSLKNVIWTMASIDLKVDKPKRSDSNLSQGDISGIISMVGPQVRGSMAISFDNELAFNILKNTTGSIASTVDDELKDMVGEMTNMVCGGAKNTLFDQGYEFEMAVPVVVAGAKHTLQHKIEGPKVIFCFSSDVGKAFLELCFVH